MTEADAVVVLDTGSSDDTVEKLRRRGAIVERAEIFPWRFDTARNRSLALVPDDADICVCTDLDEVFHPGWRAASMRYIAKSYAHKGDFHSARRYFLRAIAEAPHLREGYIDLATTLYEREDWPGVLYFTACALEITERPATYICEAAAWGGTAPRPAGHRVPPAGTDPPRSGRSGSRTGPGSFRSAAAGQRRSAAKGRQRHRAASVNHGRPAVCEPPFALRLRDGRSRSLFAQSVTVIFVITGWFSGST